jgi:hypothetical protein
MATNEELAGRVVSVLSDYLVRRARSGPAGYNAELEVLLGLVESRLSDLYEAETFARFVAAPDDATEVRTLHARLERTLNQDEGFQRQLSTAIGDPKMATPRTKKAKTIRLTVVAVGGVVILLVAFLVGRVTVSSSNTAQSANVGAATLTPLATPTTLAATGATDVSPTSTESASVSPSVSIPIVPGDGSTLAADTPVFLVNLPKPNDEWIYENGDHDVQLTQYQYSLWTRLNTCNSDETSTEQQFRLKNFKRLEVKAVGTDSTSDPTLAVKFEVFVNNDEVHPLASVVMNPGESKPIGVDLPANVFTLTLRTSLNMVGGTKCIGGNAVWGYPYVIASGAQTSSSATPTQ